MIDALLRLALALALLPVGLSAARADAAAAPIDLLAFSNGATVDHVSSVYGSGWEGLWLIDEEPSTGWANETGQNPPFEIVIAVPERSEFRQFGFDTAAAENAERSAKDVDIAVSDQSATAGFKPVMSVVLAAATDGQTFQAPAPAVGRWVRFTVRSNHGDPEYWEIMNLHGMGVALTSTPLANVSGTYDSPAYGRFHLSQSGAQLVGCYEHNEGLVQGGLEAHLMRLTWSEAGGASHGPAVMVALPAGGGFQGLWRYEGNTGSWNSDWLLKKISSDVGSCPHWRPAGARANLIAEGLAQSGRVRLYGVTFDTDSDKLRPDAKPTLDQVAAALKANASWKITVEGHTDSTSNPAHNQDLSTRRAASVRTYLAGAGISADRMTATGFGQDQPVAPNDTALGRAQNRRVEVVRE